MVNIQKSRDGNVFKSSKIYFDVIAKEKQDCRIFIANNYYD